MKRVKLAFTLAEILITLGVIGVVAAITIPNVVGNYKKQVTVAKLQKAYTTLNQAFRQSEADNGSSELWQEVDEIGVDEYFNTYWKKYFNHVTFCKTAKECGYKSSTPFSRFNGTKAGTIGISLPRVFFKTSDDVFYLFVDKTTNDKGELYPFPYVYIDINGANEPNVYGIDLFVFKRIAGKGIVPYGNEGSMSVVKATCNSKSGGDFCAARIMKEGWKINYSLK